MKNEMRENERVSGVAAVLLLSSICRKYDEEVCCYGHGTSMVVEAW